MLPNNVKMVIWDLDDTFWTGTLAEGAIAPIPENQAIVISLAGRGIISSIASKNNFAAAAARLGELGVWDYFVFPRIEFSPKGENIAAIIETAGLRAENVLFIDDNRLNLEEARQFAPGLMTAGPEILPDLLDLPQLAGKDDRALTRLKQYKNLEVKAVERATSSLAHEDFLRQCGITVEIDYDVEKNFDRIVELANRTNQLNFTKLRLETPDAIAAFQALLSSYGITAGIVRVADKYGDYGITGYFVVHRNATRNDLLHLAFSCRTMNMGIEQYIFERLKSPNIKIIPPVANPISTFEKIDWISEGAAGGQKLGAATSEKKLLLIGNCQLLQIASMCSSNRTEFVNTVRETWPVRFDDVNFILGDREKIRRDRAIEQLRYWTYEDAIRFDEELATSEIVIASLFANLSWSLFESDSGNLVRIAEDNLKRHLRNNGIWFVKNFRHSKTTTAQKLDMLAHALDHLAAGARPGSRHFALGVSTKKMPGALHLAAAGWPGCLRREPRRAGWLNQFNALPQADRNVGARHLYNRFLQDYCYANKHFTFIDVESIVTEDDVIGDPATGNFLPDHFSRRGYIAIAENIAAGLQAPRQAAAAE